MIGLGRGGAGLGIVGSLLVGGVAPATLADSFHFKDGKVIEGEVVRGTRNALTVRSGGAVHLASLFQIERVTLDLANGDQVSGELLGWEDGVFEIRSADQVLRVADGVVLEEAEPVETTTAAAPRPAAALNRGEAVAMAGLPTFVLKDGKTLIGHILHATGSIVMLWLQDSGAMPISRAQIETVRFTAEDGQEIAGRLIDWSDGAYRIEADEGELLARLPEGAELTRAAPLSAPEPIEEVADVAPADDIEQTDAAALPPDDEAAQAEVRAESGAGGPSNEAAIAALSQPSADDGASPSADPKDGRRVIETVVDAVGEDGEAAVFKFRLDQPASRPLVVLYAATEASAKAGEDFEAKSGVVTFATGSDYAEVRVPIIDDDEGEESEQFNLFLSGDPETIVFSDRQIAATINDND